MNDTASTTASVPPNDASTDADILRSGPDDIATVLVDPEPDQTEPDQTEPNQTEPDQTETEPARAASAPDPAPRKSGSTFLGIVIGAVLAVGAGYGAQRYLVPQPNFDSSPLEARLAAAEAEAQALRTEVSRLSETFNMAPPVDPALGDRVAALESIQLPDVGPLTERIDGVEANLAALAGLPSETGVSPAALAALEADVAALKSQDSGVSGDLSNLAADVEARLAEAEARATELTTQATAIATSATRNAALGQIGAALDSGLPYGAALTALGDEAVPEVIAANAETGLPSVATLRVAFPEAARLALEQALRANPGESWTDRVGTFLRNQTGARSLGPRDGTDPDAVLSRAEAALARADVQAAMAEVAALPSEAQTAMADWTALAQQRLDAKAALDGLLQGAGQ